MQTYFYRAARKRFKLRQSSNLHCPETTADSTTTALVSIANCTSPLLLLVNTTGDPISTVGKSIFIDRPQNRRKSSHQISSLECALHLAWLASKILDVVIEALLKVLKDWHSDLFKVHLSTFTSPPTNLYTSTQRLPCKPTLFNNLRTSWTPALRLP